MLRQLDERRLPRARHEGARQHDAVLRMARARIGLGAGELFFAQVDLGLIPEFDPVVGERFVELEPRGDRAAACRA